MSEWLPQIVIIEKIEPHLNADSLDIVIILGDYPVIVKREEYKIGDLACYLPIDTIVPDTEQFYFLCPKIYEKYTEGGEIKHKQVGPKYILGSVPEKSRILKAKKLRGIYSQGMLMPPLEMSVGTSIIDALGLKKWEEEEEDNIPNAKKNKGANAEKAPQDWRIPFYDIEGLRKYSSCLKDDEEIVLTEKIHGSNASFCFDGEKLWSKSRNFYKKFNEDDVWWDIAIRYDLANKLSKYPMMVFFGEIFGFNKGFRYLCETVNGSMISKVIFFDIFDVKTGQYLNYDEMLNILKELDLPATPELYRGNWLGKEQMYPYAEGLTTLGGKHVREGFVLKTTKERFEPKLNSRMQLKFIGEGYCLSK